MAAVAKWFKLTAQTEIVDELLVFSLVLALDVIKQLATLRNELQKSTTRGKILLVGIEMLGQIENSLGEKGDLVR